jgi:serine/threonine protein kinase
MACFDKNGGEVLKEAAGIVIFTELQLKKITNNYKTLLGKGAFGTVYFGRTDDNKPVAVKRSHFVEKKGGQHHQRGDFVNEIIFQFQIDHPNLVRIVGCCLETNIPVLIYDYICNGSLYNLLHVQRDNKVLMLPRRLDIAIGSAEALAYMHSHGDRDRIHGDVKSANILLGENLKPKVSDFGSSKLLSIGSYARAVAADMSYIDPVYMKTHQFVAKSDVYSFSIVLLELITRKTVNYGEDKTNSLPMDFVKSCKEKGNAREMYDSDILSHDSGAHQCNHCLECLDKIGDLAIRCLRFDVDERPTMAEVVNELKKAAKLIDKCKLEATVTA